MPLNLSISLPAAIGAFLGTTGAIMANIISFVMVGKINERASEGERISYWGWGSQVRGRYKGLYPNSHLRLLLDLCLALMAAGGYLLIKYWVMA